MSDLPDLNDESTTVAQLRELIARFVRARDWEQFHDPKNLSIAIATEAAELMEHFRWIKNDPSRELVDDPEQRRAIEEEVADVLAFTLAFANSANIDLSKALHDKMERNARKYPVDEYHGKY